MNLEATAESPTIESEFVVEKTAEMQTPTVETPTIEEQFEGFDGTSELPSLDETLDQAISDSGQDSDATAEINLDELGLNISDDEATQLASLDDLDATGTNEALVDTGINEVLDPNDATGRNPTIDLADELTDTGSSATVCISRTMKPGQNPAMDIAESDPGASISVDDDLLNATGMTQVLTEDMAVAMGTLDDADDAETLLAPIDDDDMEFAKTEALPTEAFTGDSDSDSDETVEAQTIAATDVDLDLDDLNGGVGRERRGRYRGTAARRCHG